MGEIDFHDMIKSKLQDSRDVLKEIVAGYPNIKQDVFLEDRDKKLNDYLTNYDPKKSIQEKKWLSLPKTIELNSQLLTSQRKTEVEPKSLKFTKKIKDS